MPVSFVQAHIDKSFYKGIKEVENNEGCTTVPTNVNIYCRDNFVKIQSSSKVHASSKKIQIRGCCIGEVR